MRLKSRLTAKQVRLGAISRAYLQGKAAIIVRLFKIITVYTGNRLCYVSGFLFHHEVPGRIKNVWVSKSAVIENGYQSSVNM